MKNSEKELRFQMRISAINLLRYSQNEVDDFDSQDPDAIEYQSHYEVKILPETNEIAAETLVKLKIKELDIYFAELKLQVKFQIDPFADTVKKTENGSFQIPDILIYNIFNILTSTLRGVLHEKLRGTVLQNEIFPLIDIKDLMNRREEVES